MALLLLVHILCIYPHTHSVAFCARTHSMWFKCKLILLRWMFNTLCLNVVSCRDTCFTFSLTCIYVVFVVQDLCIYWSPLLLCPLNVWLRSQVAVSRLHDCSTSNYFSTRSNNTKMTWHLWHKAFQPGTERVPSSHSSNQHMDMCIAYITWILCYSLLWL